MSNTDALISKEDQAILENMAPSATKPAEERTLADMIMDKLAAGDYTEGDGKKQEPRDLESSLD